MDSIKSNESKLTYKILFWNILCDEYSYDWKTAPKIELKYKVWEYRSQLFNSFFCDKNTFSDIYCFVEVDKQLEIYQMIQYKNNQEKNNLYDVIYFPRPNTPLGIMCVYNKYKFKLIKYEKYLLGENKNHNFALCAIFQEKLSPNEFFCVLVTHLTAWDKNENIRIKQVDNLLYCINNDKNILKYKINKFIICGDFNTGPSSKCIKQMNDNHFHSIFENEDENDKSYTMVIDTLDEGIKKLKFDYIFKSNTVNIYNKHMATEYLDFEKGIPNENFPSDHIFLQAEFGF